MKKIEIKTLEDLRIKLSKSQMAYFRDKTKDAMDAYEQLMEAREKSSDPSLMEKIYGIYIFVIYRSIFGNNYIKKDISIKLSHTIFFKKRIDENFFEVDDLEEYERLHNLIFDLVNQLYAHTDLCTEHKTINFDKSAVKGITNKVKTEMKKEKGINLDGVTKVVNVLATAYYNILGIMDKEDRNQIYYAKYDKGGWVSICYHC